MPQPQVMAATPASVIPPPAAPMPVKSDQPKADAPSPGSNGHYTIKSPMVGTFYRKPGPDKNPFVQPGDKINAGDVICVIEAMKLFNEIESDVSGTVVKVLVEDSTPVEYDQPLLLVDTSS
jgi:acetyl-CoA carboxylase biotin carboxyl carrier protein